MIAGKLDRRITIERATNEPDAFNEGVPMWSPLVTIWAAKQDVSDGERTRSAQVGATITTRFEIRWSSDVADVDGRDRIVYGGRVYSITGVKEIGRREGLELTTAAQSEASR